VNRISRRDAENAERKLLPLRLGVLYLACTLAACEVRGQAQPQSAMQFVEQKLNRFDEILQMAPDKQVETLKAEVRDILDYAGFTKQCLGKKADTLTAEEQAEFGGLLRSIMEKGYSRNPERIFSKHGITLVDETGEGDRWKVRGRIAHKEVDVEVVVCLFRKDGRWMADDVIVDELSLMESYRSQFVAFLDANPFSQLVENLKKRLAELDAPEGEGQERVKGREGTGAPQ
jgi:ABC-type transporter MlaC component